MCGICGELRFDGQAPDPTILTRMSAQLARRGPDHSGHYYKGVLAFGHRRLAIIDLSMRSDQPMVDPETGVVLVFNGAIYNYKILRKTLQGYGHRFTSEGDSEVILKAYIQWGLEGLQRLVGMFAFALWIPKVQELLLVRDRLGIKPLYYTIDQAKLRFASNTQALLAAGGVDTTIDSVALHHQLTLHGVVPAPRTILRGVRKLAPATSMQVTSNGRLHIHKYWHLRACRPPSPPKVEEWLEQVTEALKQAVHWRRMAADVPVGVLLSGGLDSSLLVALLVEAGESDLRTFSVGFEDVPEERGNEFEYSDQVVARYATQHARYLIPNKEVLRRFPEAVANMAEPMVGQDAIAFYLLAERVAKEVKVVQSGQGADEVFGGYFWYPRMAAETEGSEVDRFAQHYFDRPHSEFLETVNEAFQGEDYSRQQVAALLAEPDSDEFMDRVLHMDVTTLIVDDPVKRVDNMTMAWGLEARVPFLDHQLVELVASMPPELRLREGGKYPLKAIARSRLPAAVIDRPKGYFPVPALKFVRGPFLDFMRETLHSQACRQRGVYQQAYVDKLLANPEAYRTRLQGSRLFHLAQLEFWLQTHVDQRP